MKRLLSKLIAKYGKPSRGASPLDRSAQDRSAQERPSQDRSPGDRSAPDRPPRNSPKVELGFLVFQHTVEVIYAERLLREAGFAVEVKGPPPELRTGCDMVLVFDLMRGPLVLQTLRAARMEPWCVPVRDTLLEPVSLFQVKDYGAWFMVRAANMKITVERATGIIVNVSGGGCPDVPYLAARLTGQCIRDAEAPNVRGQTLCSYSLQRAFEEARRLWLG